MMIANPLSDITMLKDKQQPVFEDKWPNMRPTILKLLRQVVSFFSRETFITNSSNLGSCESSRMARPLLAGSLGVPLGRQGSAQSVQRPPRGHPRVHQAGPGARALTPGGAGTAESLHCGMAKVFHTMQLPSHAFWPAGDCLARQD